MSGKANALWGEQISQCGSKGRCVEMRGRPSGNVQGPQNPSPAEGFILRTEGTWGWGSLKGNDRVSRGRVGGLGWGGGGTESRREEAGRASHCLRKGSRARARGWQGRPGHLRRCPAPPPGPGTWLWAVSDVRRGGAPSGLISSGGKRHFLGSLSDSACISCGPAGRHLCWTRRTAELEEG